MQRHKSGTGSSPARSLKFKLVVKNIDFEEEGKLNRGTRRKPSKQGGNRKLAQSRIRPQAASLTGGEPTSVIFVTQTVNFIYHHQIHHQTPHPQENVVQAMEDCRLPMARP